MKYKLKKDLPFAKAGDDIIVGKTPMRKTIGIDFTMGEPTVFSAITTGDLEYLLADGWIEEVKPREWWEVEFQDAGGNWVFNGYRYKYEKQARYVATSTPQNARFIKVREVIE